jgi:hypothetical protein
MALATLAAVLFALGTALRGLGAAVLHGLGDVTTVGNLAMAGDWLRFAAGLVVLGATGYVTWRLFFSRQWSALWEVAGTALASLVCAIGLLILATKANVSEAGFVVFAIGIGGWGVLIAVSAARRASVEQDSPGGPRQAGLRLWGAAAVLLLAIATGLPNDHATLATVGEAIQVPGYAGLALVLSIARARQLIATRHFAALVAGLWALMLSPVAQAISSGVVYAPPLYSPVTPVSWRVGVSIPYFIEALAVFALAWAALGRLGELPASTTVGSKAYPWSSRVRPSSQVPSPT